MWRQVPPRRPSRAGGRRARCAHRALRRYPAQAIRVATLDAATLIGHEKDLGSITPGKFADMIAVTGDPLKDVRVLENVAHVMRGGAVVR